MWSGCLILAQRGDAGGAINIAAIAAPGIDKRGGRPATMVAGVEVGVEHAGGAGPLQFARVAVADVEPGLAELADQAFGVGADHAVQRRIVQRRMVHHTRFRLAERGGWRGIFAAAASGQQQDQRDRQGVAHA